MPRLSVVFVVLNVLLAGAEVGAMPPETTRPNFQCKEKVRAYDQKALDNAEIYFFDEHGRKERSFRLRGGGFQRRELDEGRVDWVSLDRVIPLASTDDRSRAAVFLTWTVASGSSWGAGYIQVLARDVDGQTTVEQQIKYGGRNGARARYETRTRVLHIRSGATDNADEDEKTRCWVGTFRWDGRAFQQVGVRGVPRRACPTCRKGLGCEGVRY